MNTIIPALKGIAVVAATAGLMVFGADAASAHTFTLTPRQPRLAASPN
ncbi:hypothetical protein [Pseudarthrobacter sp. SSS035]|nr:hypothetical protein [Pseudarthrobacter sp. SSS035]